MVRFGIVGFGLHAVRRLMPGFALAQRCSVTALSSREMDKARESAKKYKIPLAFDSTAELCQSNQVDAVLVTTPNALHFSDVLTAIQHNKPVLCEKPMAMNEAEARSMVQIAEESGRTFGVAYYRRMYPKVQRAKQLLAAGAIGQPVVAELTCHGWFDENESHRNWLIDPALAGGGPLYDVASHRIDVLNFLFGQPGRVTGHLSNAVHHYAVEDNATVMIDYPGGVRGIVDVRWHSKISRDECRIRGTEGEMELSPLNGPDLIYPGGRENLPPHANLHYPMIENFVDAVLGKAPLLASGASSFWTDWVTERARKAKQ